MKKTSKILTLLLCGAMALSMAGCGKTADTSSAAASTDTAAATTTSSKIDEIKKRGTLILGTSSGYPPFEFVSIENNGDIVGIDVELGQAIADKLGVDLVVEDVPFGELIMFLSSGNCDVAAAGMPETEERAEVVDFSIVYVNDEQSIIVRAEDVDKYQSLSDFEGKTVDVEMGASSETVAKDELTGANINSLSLIADCFMELKMGKCDAVVTSIIVGQQYIANDDNLVKITTAQFVNKDKPTQACVAKGNAEFLELVNEVIKENQDNGNFDKWIADYCELSSKEANG